MIEFRVCWPSVCDSIVEQHVTERLRLAADKDRFIFTDRE